MALKPGAYFVCTGAYVMYVVDPAGFTVQLDINGDYTLSTCDNSDWDWDVDADHGGCVLGNCTPLAANATLLGRTDGVQRARCDDRGFFLA